MKKLSLLVGGCAVLLFGAAVHSQAPPARQRGEQGPGPVTYSGRSPSAAAVKRFKIDAHYHFRDSPDFVKQTVDVHRKYNTMVVALTQYEAMEHTKEYVKQYPDVIIPFGGISLDDPEVLNK